jgi:hypothetical protein
MCVPEFRFLTAAGLGRVFRGAIRFSQLRSHDKKEFFF